MEVLDRDTESRVFDLVRGVLEGDKSGHDMGHIERVHRLAKRFAGEVDQLVNTAVVSLGALLHDVDDYKLVGREQADKLTNAISIMTEAGIDATTQDQVLTAIKNMGYKKSLRGIRPITLEGMIVSDADLCDAVGANGILRAYQHAIGGIGSGIVFDRNTWPSTSIGAEEYNGVGNNTHATDGFINHFFEKMLKVKSLMMTDPGRAEIERRDKLMIDFLRQYFHEEDAPEWSEFLDSYLAERG